jgi:hypothetical protein
MKKNPSKAKLTKSVWEGKTKMSRINHARQAHRGRATESANTRVPSWARGGHRSAVAANAGRSLVGAEREAHLERLGMIRRTLTVEIIR